MTTEVIRNTSTDGRSAGRITRRVLFYLVLSIAAFAMVVPFLWMVLTSLKSPAEVNSFSWLPTELHWENYGDAMSAAPFLDYFRNSFILAVGQTALTLTFATAAGYALAKLPIRGKKYVMWYVIALLMVPFQVVIVPLFLVVKQIPLFGGNDIFGQGGSGWLDSWWGLIIPLSMGPLFIFLSRQFFTTLPDELAEAARIDGVSEYGIFVRIMLPLVKPALVTIGVFQIEASWNSFIWPLIATRSPDLRPLQLGLAIFSQDELNVQWNYLMAGATLATVPMIVLFILAQRYFVEGLASSGLKG
ncbi:carbohydrate ABC transporter permease [Salinibacterium sp. G-O1]|uniref:carbohydrate ABC transporter permease n=1 Tax=Salinibacterium sp. G-O1 TaxID=3046208 RepID=UPI0024B9745F|nr:carbohydrate ABC transporter permease [Salinibacterium sp. G-O1]MDJ0334066.1 carbohydrate ABC transporter permease [Salinibacterium sp. G-O1]